MPQIYFLRHGQTDYNAAGRIQGTAEVPINAKGQAQALRNGHVLNELISDKAQFDFVASPLLRTRQTMEIVRSILGLNPQGYRTDGRLKEIDFGAWGGMTLAEIAATDPENYAKRQADPWNVAPPKGQCFREFYAQTMSWFHEVIRDTIVVAHGGTSRCLRGHVLKLTPQQMVELDVPQDKVLLIEDDKIAWF
ncbi:MAG TPA: histidine phosphatase family protein [Hyphomicrobiales bacterium]|nr:histidine phosphatase family protein [Hyphomicrobiales bacterium]